MDGISEAYWRTLSTVIKREVCLLGPWGLGGRGSCTYIISTSIKDVLSVKAITIILPRPSDPSSQLWSPNAPLRLLWQALDGVGGQKDHPDLRLVRWTALSCKQIIVLDWKWKMKGRDYPLALISNKFKIKMFAWSHHPQTVHDNHREPMSYFGFG